MSLESYYAYAHIYTLCMHTTVAPANIIIIELDIVQSV